MQAAILSSFLMTRDFRIKVSRDHGSWRETKQKWRTNRSGRVRQIFYLFEQQRSIWLADKLLEVNNDVFCVEKLLTFLLNRW